MVREVMLAASTASAIPSYNIRDKAAGEPYSRGDVRIGTQLMTATCRAKSTIMLKAHYALQSCGVVSCTVGEAICAVCGDGHAKLHYGVLACYGCKGFFRRTLTGKYRYVCRFGNNCIVDKYQRNSCRYCRFQRCLEVGMDPKAVRPDRDLTGKQKVPRLRKRQIDEELLNHMLMNIEAKVVKGDTASTASENVSSKNVSLRELFEQKPILDGRRTEMRYEPYRMARIDELPQIAHRRAIAAVDWVDSLTEIADLTDTEDKVALVKSCYSPLTIFNFSARTAQNTKNPDILCLCSFSYVPRKLPPEFNQTNHLSDNLIDRTLNELVAPLRKLNLKEEEVVPLKAIIILNPNAKGLSPTAQQVVSELRDRVQDMLFQVVKELHPVYSASSRFGNLLLLLPTIMTLSGIMCENLQFVQAFGGRHTGDHLLGEMFGDVCAKLDEPVTSSSSPPTFENPAEISLQSISPPLTQSRVSSTIWLRSSQSRKSDCGTQTDFDDHLCPTLSCGYGDPFQISLNPFQSLLDDDLGDFSPTPGYTNLNSSCNDLFALMDDMR
uniref:Nuclear receptor domain-containing protein n=1 Tax=Ascaris lumbricoides TaxID=6252 RepID=A0A9J2PQK3_ASCLU